MSNKQAFTTFLSNLADGDVAIRLTDDLDKMHTALMEQVSEHHSAAKGEMLIKLKFKSDQAGVVHVDTDIKVKEPRAGTPTAVRWLSDSGFSEENPHQQKLPLRGVTRIEGGHDA